MTKRKTAEEKAKPKKPQKYHVARTPREAAVYKRRYLDQLSQGYTPTIAAENINIARCTVYVWKKEDDKFAADWDDAVEQGLDRLENNVFQNGMQGNSLDAHFILKHRRREIFGNQDNMPKPSFILNITLAEHLKRLENLGLPLPVLEGDYDVEDEAE